MGYLVKVTDDSYYIYEFCRKRMPGGQVNDISQCNPVGDVHEISGKQGKVEEIITLS